MKRLYTALFSLMLVFGLSANSLAANTYTIDGNPFTFPAIEPLTVPGSYSIGNDTASGDLTLAGGSVLDYWNFTVESTASYGSLIGSIGLNGNGFSSFATALETFVTGDGGGWTTIATGATTGFGNLWASIITFSPLSPDPTAYRLVVSGTQVPGEAAYGGNVTVSPVPEPEIYAMMAAGLGLMGFVARRRQRNGAVA